MAPMISHAFLQGYWWIIISLLAGILVFLLFVQGGQTFIFSLPADELRKKMLVNTLGRKWEFTFTTLVTFGGAFFASFPLFYATSFGGAYWVWMAILFSFIIQAVAYEYRSKPANIFGTRTYDIFLLINGSAGPFLLGTAVATFFTGANFSLDIMNRVQWNSPWHGLEAIASFRNLSLGFAVLFLSRVNGLLFIIKTIEDNELQERASGKLIMNSLFFLLFFLYFVVTLLTAEGFSLNPADGKIFMEKFKYLHNFTEMPLVLILFLAGTLAVLYGIFTALFRRSSSSVWFTGAGTILVVFSLFLILGFSNTAFYPSLSDLQSSLTIHNASSGHFTLRTMMFVSFVIPFVMAYIWYAWRAITNRKITGEEINKDDHAY